MACTYPLNPVERIKNFLNRDDHVGADMETILSDPDALAVNAMTIDQLADELRDIQPRVEAKIALVAAMVGADVASSEDKPRCVRAVPTERRSLPRAGRSYWRAVCSSVFRKKAYAAVFLVFGVTAISGVYLYKERSHAEPTNVAANQRELQEQMVSMLRDIKTATAQIQALDAQFQAFGRTVGTASAMALHTSWMTDTSYVPSVKHAGVSAGDVREPGVTVYAWKRAWAPGVTETPCGSTTARSSRSSRKCALAAARRLPAAVSLSEPAQTVSWDMLPGSTLK